MAEKFWLVYIEQHMTIDYEIINDIYILNNDNTFLLKEMTISDQQLPPVR